MTPPLVFLHIPRATGQAIHRELARVVGEDGVSPIRTHTQAGPGAAQLPPRYRLYSGHLDWLELDALPARFAFTVLRDPFERIASFYFYLLDQAERLAPEALARPEHTGERMILTHGADDYFFGGDAAWQAFVRDHYDNFYTSYLATRRMRGREELAGLRPHDKMSRALEGAARLDRVYATTRLEALEADIAALTGQQVSLVGHYVNVGFSDPGFRRWPALLERLERDSSARRLARFGSLDEQLMENLGLPTEDDHDW
jgi:hypothetical protein